MSEPVVNPAVEPEAIDEPVPETGFTPAVNLAKSKLPAPPAAAIKTSLGISVYSTSVYWAREIELTEFDGFLKELYKTVNYAIYRRDTRANERFLSRKDFLTVMHYAQQMRLFAVIDNYRWDDRPKSWINFRKAFVIPKAFAVLLNRIGLFAIDYGAFEVLPFPVISDAAETLRTDFKKVEKRYNQLINFIQSNESVALDVVTDQLNGSGAWLLDTTEEDRTTPATVDSETLVVKVPFADASEGDLRDAALLAHGVKNTKFYAVDKATAFKDSARTVVPQYWTYAPTFRQAIQDRLRYYEFGTIPKK